MINILRVMGLVLMQTARLGQLIAVLYTAFAMGGRRFA